MRKFYFFFSILLAGCAIAPQNDRQISVYDFGINQISSIKNTDNDRKELSRSLLIAEANAPIWLNNNAIQYRLAYSDPIQLYTYANSRWAAPPATLLTHYIRNSIANKTNNKVLNSSDSVRPDYILRLELEEFIQTFNATEESQVIIRLRASLINRDSRLLEAQHSFGIEMTSPSANAAGAAQALTKSSVKITEELISWITEKLN